MIRPAIARIRGLVDTPIDLARGLVLTLFAAMLVVKLIQVAVAAGLGLLAGLTPRHVLTAPGALAADLGAACLAGGGLAAGAALLRRLPRGGALSLAWLLLGLPLVVGHAAAQVVFYRLFQAPLTFQQLQLVGTLSDLSASASAGTPWWAVTLLLTLPVASLLALPLVAGFARGRRKRGLLVAALVTTTALALMPPGGCAGLERNGLIELALSTARGLGGGTGAAPDLGPKPRFDRSPESGDPTPQAGPPPFREGARTRPGMSVVLFVLESASTRLMGYPRGLAATMPRLASLGESGVAFERYYAITPVSMKSLVSITCSIHPYTEAVALTYVNPNIRCADLAEVLKDRGYRTGLFHSGHFHYSDKDRFFRARGYEVLRDADKLKARGRYPRNAWGADDRAMTDDALAWLRTLPAESPFLLVLIPVTPHHPYSAAKGAPLPFGTATVEDRYRNGLRFVDDQIGRIADAVEARGGTDDTLFVVVGDHGEAFGEHAGHTMHGSYIYEEAVRVPLILSNPTLFGGVISPSIGNHVDLAPTVLEALGLPAEERHEGRSLLAAHEPHQVHFYTRYAHHQLGLRDGRWKYIRDRDLSADLLFDLDADPGETRNLAAGHPDLVERFRATTTRFEAFYRTLIPAYEAHWFPGETCRGVPVCHLDEVDPMFAHGTVRKRKSSRGGPLKVGGRRYARGLGVHAPSILRFSVRGLGYAWLEGAVGHDDDIYAGQLAEEVAAEIYVDGELAFSSGKKRKGDAAAPFRVPIEGARVIELFGHDMDGIGYRDMIDWVEVRLTR